MAQSVFTAGTFAASAAAAAMLIAAGSAFGLETEKSEPSRLIAGEVLAGTLAEMEPASYEIELEADTFVVGSADQVSVDVVVNVYGPDGGVVYRQDGLGVGPEPIQFTADEAGVYRVEVAPFEDEAGDYTLSLSRVEPVATDPAERVGQLMTAYDRPCTPGAVVGVFRGGEIVFAEGYGLANLPHGIEFTPDTPTNIGSSSKQFTAFAICLLSDRGELSLDDDVRKHIPELPDFGSPVTLRHLITHTSGYREYLNLLAMGGRVISHGDHIKRDEVVELIQRQPELQNEPGAEWNYNNSGYVLLTMVVENVTGQPFVEWMDENVFTPLGMDDTMFRTSRGQVVPGLAAGYSMGEGGYQRVDELAASMGPGGLYTTVNDMAKWIENFAAHRVGGDAVFEQMTETYVLKDGKDTGYAMGLFIDEAGGLTKIHHGGADRAHRSMVAYYPEIEGGVVTFSNNASFGTGVADEIAELFFADAMETSEAGVDGSEGAPQPSEGEAGPSLTAAEYGTLVGDFEFEEMQGFVLSITRDGETLYGQATRQPKVALQHESGTTFKLSGTEIRVEFVIEDDGACPALFLHQGGKHKAVRKTEEPWAPSAEELAAYTGRYFSEELEAFYNVEVEDGALKVVHRRFEVGLNPGDKDEFGASYPLGKVEFVRDEGGSVTGLIASNGRARGITFDRTN